MQYFKPQKVSARSRSGMLVNNMLTQELHCFPVYQPETNKKKKETVDRSRHNKQLYEIAFS